MGGISSISFNLADYDKKANVIFEEGVQDILAHSSDPEQFMDACGRMEGRFKDLNQSWKPPEKVIGALNERKDRLISSIIRYKDIDLTPYFGKKLKKVACQILNGLGVHFTLDNPTKQCISILKKNRFEDSEITEILDNLCKFDAKLEKVIPDIKNRKFLEFLAKNGAGSIAIAARDALLPVQSSFFEAKVIPFRIKQRN